MNSIFIVIHSCELQKISCYSNVLIFHGVSFQGVSYILYNIFCIKGPIKSLSPQTTNIILCIIL